MNQSLRRRYDVAAENILTFAEVLKFHLFLEQAEPIAELPEEIPEEEVLSLYAHPGRLPRYLLNFIRLQNEIFDDDGEEVLALNMPTGLEKYFVKARLLRKTKKRRERERIIEAFLKAFERFSTQLLRTFAYLKATEAHYREVRTKIDDEMKTMQKPERAQFADIERAMQKVQDHLKKTREILEDNELENMVQLVRIQEEIEEDNMEIASLSMRFGERLILLRKFWARRREKMAFDAVEEEWPDLTEEPEEEPAPRESIVRRTARAAQTVAAAAGSVVNLAQHAADAVRDSWPDVVGGGNDEEDEEETAREDRPDDVWADIIEDESDEEETPRPRGGT